MINHIRLIYLPIKNVITERIEKGNEKNVDFKA